MSAPFMAQVAARIPVSIPDRLALYHRNRLKLGVLQHRLFVSTPRSHRARALNGNLPDCLRLARMADDAGIEFMLPVGRWKGYRGDTDYQGDAGNRHLGSGLLGATRRLTVFGTVHAPLIHPSSRRTVRHGGSHWRG